MTTQRDLRPQTGRIDYDAAARLAAHWAERIGSDRSCEGSDADIVAGVTISKLGRDNVIDLGSQIAYFAGVEVGMRTMVAVLNDTLGDPRAGMLEDLSAIRAEVVFDAADQRRERQFCKEHGQEYRA